MTPTNPAAPPAGSAQADSEEILLLVEKYAKVRVDAATLELRQRITQSKRELLTALAIAQSMIRKLAEGEETDEDPKETIAIIEEAMESNEHLDADLVGTPFERTAPR
jgi:hypothetical protein